MGVTVNHNTDRFKEIVDCVLPMSTIFYRFKNSKDTSHVRFNGPRLSLDDLKAEIMCATGNADADFDLKVTNAQTKKGKWTPMLRGVPYAAL